MEDIFSRHSWKGIDNVPSFLFFGTTEGKITISINQPGFNNVKNKISLMSYRGARGTDCADT